MTQILNEVKRSQSLNKSKRGKEYADWNQLLGKNRHERRLHQKVSHSVTNYNKLNMNKLFKDGILDVNIDVKGETDDYTVRISFAGFLDYFQKNVSDKTTIKLRDVSRALTQAFNSDDVYFHCDCPDWKYRHAYWAIQNNVNASVDFDADELSHAPNGPVPKITNPNDDKGGMCKHVAMVMSNNSWIMKVASVIRNYSIYMKQKMPDLFYKVIYPALYGEKYSEQDQQMDIYDVTGEEPELDTSEDELDTTNKWAKTKSQFKPGNKYRFKSNSEEEIPGQKTFDFDSVVSD